MNVAGLAHSLSAWIGSKVAEAGTRGAVVGVSGGIDSAVVLGLCKMALDENVFTVVMPCYSQQEDIDDAALVIQRFGARSATVILDRVLDELISAVGAGDVDPRNLALANIRPRLRMTTLYYFASRLNYLVAGTGNRSELYAGYFTKWGDGGVDILPIGGLVKRQVRELAGYLGVPERVRVKPPTAGLWPGQTDEGEMGLSYDDIDNYLLTGTGEPDVVRRLEQRHKATEHKRRVAPVPEIWRD